MREGKKEDLLEEIFLQTRNGSSSAPVSCCTSRLKISCDELESLVRSLVREGALLRDEGDQVCLTAQGILRAEQVVKKHLTLEHFFVEMLGADPAMASREACRLEHHISDEMTGRLSDLVDRSTERGGRESSFPAPRSLLNFEEGDQLVIVWIEQGERMNRLMDLGFLPGEPISIKRKLRNHALVVGVKGCDIALSPDIASRIQVEKYR